MRVLLLSVLFVAAFCLPSQVHISYPGQTGKVLVMWVSPSSDNAYVQYGTSQGSLNQQSQGQYTQYSFEGYTSQHIFSALMEGLSPSTTYYYRVGSASDGWSSVFSFKNNPADGTPDIRFGVMGDVGSTDNSNATIHGLMKLRDSEGMDHILHAGDLSYANNYNPGGPVWDKYGHMLEPLAAYTTYNPSVGNHETIDNFMGFRLRYDTEELEKPSRGGNFYWSYNYGFVHVIMLSSETEYEHGGDQYNWLEADLKAINRQVTPWVVAIWHRPWYNSNSAHSTDGEKMQASFEDLFYTYKVDLGLCGHVHAYERTTAVYKNKITKGATSYVTLGNGGTPEGLAKNWKTKPDWSVFRIAEYGHSYIHFVNSTHAQLRMFLNSDGSVADEAWYTR